MAYIPIIYIILGILPSLIWLFYYLRKDAHPEPKRMVLEVFLWGVFITVPVFFIQIASTNLLDALNINPTIRDVIYWFLVISFSEEFFKYLVIRWKVINNPNLDEPLDIMLYMVIAALGFAALENTLYLFAPGGQMSFTQLISRTLTINLIRFLGAIFLHTLCSAIVGYFLAVSFCSAKRRAMLVVGGIFIATLLHGLYDFSIMTLDGYMKFVIPILLIITLAFVVFYKLGKLKKMKSICKLA